MKLKKKEWKWMIALWKEGFSFESAQGVIRGMRDAKAGRTVPYDPLPRTRRAE